MYLCQFGQNLAIGSEETVQVTDIYSYIKVLSMKYMCQFGQNMAIGSEDRVQKQIFHRIMTLVTLKIKSRSPKSPKD